MVRSLGLVALGLIAWMYFAHPRAADGINEVQWVPVTQAAASVATYQVLAPPADLPWPATSARVESNPDGTLAWRAGFYTPEEAYAAILQRGAFPAQATEAQQDWVAEETRNGVAEESVMTAGTGSACRGIRSPTSAGRWSTSRTARPRW